MTSEGREEIPGKVINDPIHGHVELHPLLIKIIDTHQFQRLRYMKQLGGVYFVYPGASHNRFEHSIGVAHLAGELLKSLRARQPELGITDRDMLCVQIAGLCHDLGHGPFSHMFDSMFIPKVRPDTTWKHEKASCDMFDHLVEQNKLEPVMEQHGLVLSEDLVFIKEMIEGPQNSSTTQNQEWPYKGRTEDKSFLYEIVANKTTGIDVDKFDYFARDCYHLGLQNNFDYHRFLKFARVCEVEDNGKKQICIRDKEVYNLYNMFHTRYSIHRRACQHRVSSIIQTMMADAFVKADKHIQIEGSHRKMFTLSEAIDDMEAYTKLTDCVFEQILNFPSKGLKRKQDESENERDKEMGEAKQILRRIITRDLYKCLGEIGIKPSIHEEGICGDLKKKLTEPPEELEPRDAEAASSTHGKEIYEKLKKKVTKLELRDIEVVPISMDYGMKYEDPIENVRFYSKDEPNKGFKIEREQVSNVLPIYFTDELVRVYYKGTNEAELKTAKENFEEWWDDYEKAVRFEKCSKKCRSRNGDCVWKMYRLNPPRPQSQRTTDPNAEENIQNNEVLEEGAQN